jgi:predicted nucleotidyltransferase
MSDRQFVVCSWSGPWSISRRLLRGAAPTWENARVRVTNEIELDDHELADLCLGHGIRRLALFGSALTGELGPDSDIDLLVEFEPGRVPGLLGIAALELELEALLGRRVDVRTAADLSRHFRQAVADEARPLYAAA